MKMGTVLFDISTREINAWILPLIIMCVLGLPVILYVIKMPKVVDKIINIIGLSFLIVLSFLIYQFIDTFGLHDGEQVLETRGLVSDVRRPKAFQTIGHFRVGGKEFAFYRFDPLGRFSNKCPKCLDGVEKEVTVFHKNNVILKIVVENDNDR